LSDDKGQLIELPNGSALFYMDDSHPNPKMRHSYWRARRAKVGDGWIRGKRLTGVTTAIKPIDFDPGRLLTWAARTQCVGIAELVGPALLEPAVTPDDLGWLNSADSIWRELEQAELTFEHVRDRAGRRGTNVHERALMALASGEPVPDFEGLADDEQGYANAVVEFWLDHAPDPLNVEQVVYSEELGVAGRMDLRARIQGKVILLDAKTSGFIGEKDHVQVAGYDHLATDCGIGDSEEQWILRLAEDGGYEVIPSEATRADFLAAVDLYRRRGRIRSEASAAWRARQGEG
jgi:hypothetical protein